MSKEEKTRSSPFHLDSFLRSFKHHFCDSSSYSRWNSIQNTEELIHRDGRMFISMIVLCASVAAAVRMPFIPNATFVPLSTSNSTTMTNRSCNQCLCDSHSSHMILNCFPNATCQFFFDAPRTYKIQSTPNALLYFPRQILPNASESCASNTSFLLNRLNTTMPTYANVPVPLRLLLDDRSYLATISQSNQSIFRFHPNNLTRIEQPPSPIFSEKPSSLAHRNGMYYVGFTTYILVFDSSNMSQVDNITTTVLYGTRDILFLNDGQLMIVTSTSNNRLVYFNRSSATPEQYNVISYQTVSYQDPHGLFRGNDTFFYLTSWQDNSVHTYAYAGNITHWTEKLLLNTSSAVSSSTGYHVTIDNSGRYWFSLGTYGTKIFDRQGLASWHSAADEFVHLRHTHHG